MRHRLAGRLLGPLFGFLALAPTAVPAEATAEPEDYRADNYRAPTPATLKGARVVTTAEAQRIWEGGAAIFIDVLPQPPRPQNLPPGTIWRDKPRRNIPGSAWLPDTGYGALAGPMEDYMRSNLVRLTGGDPARMLVIYCLRDCWMSWNAARRAMTMGFTNVVWYPEGTDGWEDELLPVKECSPEPRPGE